MEQKINDVLSSSPCPLTASEIAKVLVCTKKEINQVIYYINGVEKVPDTQPPKWRLKEDSSGTTKKDDTSLEPDSTVSSTVTTSTSLSIKKVGATSMSPDISKSDPLTKDSKQCNDDELRSLILDVLKKQSTPLTAPEISRQLSGKIICITADCKRVLHGLQKEGRVENRSPAGTKPLWILKGSSCGATALSDSDLATYKGKPLFTYEETKDEHRYKKLTKSEISLSSSEEKSEKIISDQIDTSSDQFENSVDASTYPSGLVDDQQLTENEIQKMAYSPDSELETLKTKTKLRTMQELEETLSLLMAENEDITKTLVITKSELESLKTELKSRIQELEDTKKISDIKDTELENLKTEMKLKEEKLLKVEGKLAESSLLYSIEYKLQQKEFQLQAALHRIMELNNENEMKRKISHIKDIQLEKSEAILKSKQEKLQNLEEKFSLLTRDVEKNDETGDQSLSKNSPTLSLKDAAVQFDYWVPMEDLLHGARVVDEIVFNVQGDTEQFFNWNECGFSLFVPEGALLPTETCAVAVKALIAGRFRLPKRTKLVSAYYAISASRKFRKHVKTELQHCLLLENERQTKHLHFIKAHQMHLGMPYLFELQKGGEFVINTHYAALWQAEFSIEAIVKAEPYPNNEGSSNGSDNSTEEGGNQEDGEDVENVEHISTEADEFHHISKDDEHVHPNELQVGHSDSQECSSMSVNQLPGNQQTEPNTQPTRSLESKNTQTEQTTDDNNQIYRAHTFYKMVSGHVWQFQFVAIKHLEVHIKYIMKELSHLEKDDAFKFRFKQDSRGSHHSVDPSIVLSFPNKDIVSNGWSVQPHKLPCEISKEEIDLLGTQELHLTDSSDVHIYPDIPMCRVSLYADDVTSGNLRYPTAIEGIVKKKTIVITRPKPTFHSREQTSKETSQLVFDHYKQAQGIHESELQGMDLPEVITTTNEVVDWFTLGLYLRLAFEELETIEKNYPGDIKRCRQKMLNSWISSGNATWSVLRNVLRKMNEGAVADKIEEKYLTK